MNRTIKFRGKRVDNGEWVYGYYVKDPKGNHRIYLQPFAEATSNTYFFVIPETVGQFTGLTDKNGKEIYEGDILIYYCISMSDLEVFWKYDSWWGRGAFIEHPFNVWISAIDFEGIELQNRTIHDNPELLNQ